MANNELTHNGYAGSVDVSVEDDCLHGRILFIDDIVTYEGNTVPEVAAAFKAAVDRYIAHCKDMGKEPNKPYSGTFNVRVGPQRHRAMAQRAYREKTSLNELFCQATDLFLTNNAPTVSAATTVVTSAANPVHTFWATGTVIAKHMKDLAASYPDIAPESNAQVFQMSHPTSLEVH